MALLVQWVAVAVHLILRAQAVILAALVVVVKLTQAAALAHQVKVMLEAVAYELLDSPAEVVGVLVQLVLTA